ncbi:hypothetical protein [uncultured Sunxiuqinia sp.]|uniref:hypothetical protein n=1 Tax=uncultured Sunxiuqinia sp. TaxID=1573825 RepID=UPI0030DAC43A
MSTILDSLKSYFQDNSREQIEKDWAEYEKYDKIGLKVDESIEQSKLLYGYAK